MLRIKSDTVSFSLLAGLRAAVRLPSGVRRGHDQHLQHPGGDGALHLPQAGPGRSEAQEAQGARRLREGRRRTKRFVAAAFSSVLRLALCQVCARVQYKKLGSLAFSLTAPGKYREETNQFRWPRDGCCSKDVPTTTPVLSCIRRHPQRVL